MSKWFKLQASLRAYVSKYRLGIRGVRPFGSNKNLKSNRKGQGARLRATVPGVATTISPLERVFEKTKKWFKQEREHGHEVRGTTLNMRLLYLLEAERDRELVLKQCESPEHLPYVLAACREKLHFSRSSIPRSDSRLESRTSFVRELERSLEVDRG